MGAARFERASDRTLLVSFGEEITRETHQQVRALLVSLQNDPIASTLNLHPAYCSLLIKFDPRRTTHEEVERRARERVVRANRLVAEPARQVEVPVCYDVDFGPDLAALSDLRGLSTEDLIRLHSRQTYTVYFLGFVPGFAYLGTVPDTIAAPRLSSPRQRVEAGSVGIAGRQTGIYPCPVPGGWRLIGRTPLAMFRAERDPMSLLAPGDEVRFLPISRDEYVRIEAGAA
jgi:KipI family sensor histidine kinase inhibitor